MFTDMQLVKVFITARSNYGIKPVLFRMYKLLDYLNDPHKKLKAIHITGTNGKGSTLQFIKQALMTNDHHVGLFTSPSLSGMHGHIQINDHYIEDDELIDQLNRLYPVIVQLDSQCNHPTEFEIMTVIAFNYFVNQVDVALIETGMGGREDTTNCLHPILSIITNIDKDHTQFLGQEIKKIAYHKAGIIKYHVPVIVGDVCKEAAHIINQEIEQQQTTGLYLNKDFTYAAITGTEAEEHFNWSDGVNDRQVQIQMLGHHQLKNCSIAIMALTMIEQYDLPLDWQKTLYGIRRATLSGRFERMKKNPTIILDGAHNVAGIRAFLQTVQTHYPNVRRHLIFAAFKDKDIPAILSEVEGAFTSITLTTFHHPRAAKTSELIHFMKKEHHQIITDWKEALAQIEERKDDYYFITGSLHFISNVRHYLNQTT